MKMILFAALVLSFFMMSCADGPAQEASELNGTWSQGCSNGTTRSYAFAGSKLTVTTSAYADTSCNTLNTTTTSGFTVANFGAANANVSGAKNVDLTVGTSQTCPTNGSCTTSSSNVGQTILGIYKIEDIDGSSHRLSFGTSAPQVSPAEESRSTNFTVTLTRRKPANQ